MFNKKYATPNGLQLALIISGFAVYVVGFLQTVSIFVQHVVNNPNFSGIWSLLIWQAIPPLLFGMAYFLNPRKKLSQTPRMFEAMVLTVSGLAIFTVLSQLASYAMNLGTMMGGDSYAIYELSVMAVLLLSFGFVLWFLGHKKYWK